MHKPTIIVEKIELTPQQREEIQSILDTKTTKAMMQKWESRGVVHVNKKMYRLGTSYGKRHIVKRKFFYGGISHRCHDWPAYKVLRKKPDITVVEFYCEKHLPYNKS